MNKGFTLLEVIIGLFFGALISLGFIFMITMVKEDIIKAQAMNQHYTDLYTIDERFIDLQRLYNNKSITLRDNAIYCDDVCLMQIEECDDDYCYHFLLEGTEYVYYVKVLFSIEYVNPSLFKIKLVNEDFDYVRYFYISEVNYENNP